ncbi:MAG: DUF1659 domain-containing protein [Peptostreptococcaceae bacterium]|nr:DUF1659 domain-containing protein [Peptostreptococcaceae bacterium]
MAVSETKNASSLKLKFDCGLNDDGKTVIKSRTYSNVKADAAYQDVFDIAKALVDLQIHDNIEILKQDNTVLN